MPDQAEIDEHRDNDRDQIKSFDGMVGVHHPRIDDGGHWQEDEAEKRDKEAVIGVVQVAGEQPHQEKNYAREQENDERQQARHDLMIRGN